MTGYARAEGAHGQVAWTWELRSVNGKGLDLRLRLPAGYERLEPELRSRTGARLTRGNISATLSVAQSQGAARPVINRALLDDLLALRETLGDRISNEPMRLDALAAVRGVIDLVEEESDPEVVAVRETAIMDTFDAALDGLNAARREEGARLDDLLRGQLAELSDLITAAGANAATQPEAIRARIKKQVEDLLGASPALNEERLIQEVALLAVKADIREEIDRLDAHVTAAREMLAAGGAVGRRLDFLCQEFNREANTLCSKATDIDLTRIGLAMKAVIDRMREQVQNVE